MQETKVNTGGPAFPCEQGNTPDGCWNQTFESGMSIRDYFAAKVLHASITTDTDYTMLPIDHARWAYEVADAMIEARSK